MNQENAKLIADQWLRMNPQSSAELVTGRGVENEHDFIFSVVEKSGEPLFGPPLPVAVSKKTQQVRLVFHSYLDDPHTLRLDAKILQWLGKLAFWKKSDT